MNLEIKTLRSAHCGNNSSGKIGFFSYEAKYNWETKNYARQILICEQKEIENMAVLAHNAIGEDIILVPILLFPRRVFIF